MLFHELTHSTGHEKRLGRKGILESHSFGDQTYSKEELIAEMGAAFLCATAGIETCTLDNSASYIASWMTFIRGADPRTVVMAAGQAQRAADLILGRTFEDGKED